MAIEDNDTAKWKVSADSPEIDEGGSALVIVSVSNGKSLADEQSFTLAVSGTADDSDYTLSTTELTLPAGSDSVGATVPATNDDLEEGDETATVTVSHDGQAIGEATATILANDVPPSTDATLSSLDPSGIGAFIYAFAAPGLGS